MDTCHLNIFGYFNLWIVNKKTYQGCGKYIGRPSIFGNPFRIGPDGNRKEVIEKYESWVRKQPKVLKAIKNLKEDETLVCFCAPEACHGMIIEKIWKELNQNLTSSSK